MRLIYTDEAGTSPKEPVRVVASVIVDGDRDWRRLDGEIRKLVREAVPKAYQTGFIFHGKEVFSGGRSIERSEWKFQERLDFFKRFLRIPRDHGIPISLGVVFSGYLEQSTFPVENKRKWQWEHALAFSRCLERADHFLRRYSNGAEVGTVIAEDVPQMRVFLKKYALVHRDFLVHLTPQQQRPEAWQTAWNMQPHEVTFEVKHIIDVPHFVEKREAPILQLADACAFAFRRCLSRQSSGNDLVLAMLGEQVGQRFVSDDVWYSLTSSGLFNTERYWTPEQRIHELKKEIVRPFI